MRRIVPIIVLGVCWLIVSNSDAGPASVPKPPKDYQQVMDLGRVEFQFYDPKKEPRERAGKATFKLNVKWDFNTKFKWKRDGDVKRVTITPTIGKWKNDLTHVVLLPQEYAKSAKFWNSQLVRHEFDHVAISIDPRPRRIIEHLCRKLTTVEATIPADEEVTANKAAELVDAEFKKRRAAVNDLLLKNYELLDAVSQHGKQTIQDRRAFFADLYMKANLADTKFPYIDDVLDLLETEEYTKAEERPKPTKQDSRK